MMNIITKLKAVILSLLKIFSRCLCFLRKRRNSDVGTKMIVSSKSSVSTDNSPDTWDDWESPEIVISEKKPSSTYDHIEAYRNNLVYSRQKSQEDSIQNEEDLFSEMAPKIRKQKRIFVGKEVSPNCDKFAVRPENNDPVLAMGAELGSWEDSDKRTGWNPEEESLADILKEKRNRR